MSAITLLCKLRFSAHHQTHAIAIVCLSVCYTGDPRGLPIKLIRLSLTPTIIITTCRREASARLLASIGAEALLIQVQCTFTPKAKDVCVSMWCTIVLFGTRCQLDDVSVCSDVEGGGDEGDERRHDWLVQGLFQRWDDAYRSERFVIFNVESIVSRARVTYNREWTSTGSREIDFTGIGVERSWLLYIL